MSSRGIRDTLADRISGGEKNFCCVTKRRANYRVLNGLGCNFGLPLALLLGLGMPDFDVGILTTIRLAAGGLSAADLSQAFLVLAVALVPAPWLVLASASFAQANPRTRSPGSGQTAVSLRNVECAHGSCDFPGKARGECWSHSPRALLKLEQDA